MTLRLAGPSGPSYDLHLPAGQCQQLVDLARRLGIPLEEYLTGILAAHLAWVDHSHEVVFATFDARVAALRAERQRLRTEQITARRAAPPLAGSGRLGRDARVGGLP